MVRTKQVEEHGAAVLGIAVRREVDLLVPELVEEVGGGAGKLDSHSLHPVAQLWAHGLHDGNGAVLVQVHLQLASRTSRISSWYIWGL